MLRILREHATSWMLRGLLILVAVTFISWGGYSLIREKEVTYAAKVDEDTIEMKDYYEAYQAAVKQYRDAMGPSFSEKMLEGLRLKERTLEGMISQVLLLKEAKRLGMKVGDEELKESLESIPYFQVGGRFDPRAYERFLRFNRMTADEFERTQRDRLLITKAVTLVRLNAGRVSEDEVLETYRFDNERINLAFLKVSPDPYKGQVSVNELEEKDYYQRNQEDFRVPTYVQIQYLQFRSADFEGKAQVTPDDVQKYYDRQKERFKIPKRVKAREILVKVDLQDSPEKIEEKRKRAEEILEKAKKTKDFAALARQASEGETASKGGDLGWVQAGSLDETIQNALFALKPGEVSSVVKGLPGFTILKAEEVVEEKQRSLEEVKEQITQSLKRDKGRAEASRRADDAFYSLFRSRDLETYAKEKGIPIKTTPLFKEGDEVPEFGRNPAFQSSALALKVGEISAVVNIPPNFYLLKLVDKKESRIPPFEEVKAEVRQRVVALKVDEKAREVAEGLLGEVQSGKALKKVGEEKGLPVQETGFFTRTAGVVPKIGPSEGFMPLLSSLTNNNPVPKEVIKTKDGYFVASLLAQEPADESKFPAVKKDLERRLTFQKQEEVFDRWLKELRANSNIEINQDVLKS